MAEKDNESNHNSESKSRKEVFLKRLDLLFFLRYSVSHEKSCILIGLVSGGGLGRASERGLAAMEAAISPIGYDGQCHMNTLITMMIRDLPARLIMLKLGINMMTGSYNARSFEPAVIGFVRILREGHPWIPIGLVSSI